MKKIKKLKGLLTIFVIAVASLSSLYVLPPKFAEAASCGSPTACEAAARACQESGRTWDGTRGVCTDGGTDGEGADTDPIAPSTEKDCTGDDLSQDCKIVEYLLLFINVLSAMVGVVIIVMIIVGGIQYTTSAGDPQAVAKAKSRIYNAVLALVIFIFGFGVLQWLVPGGIL